VSRTTSEAVERAGPVPAPEPQRPDAPEPDRHTQRAVDRLVVAACAAAIAIGVALVLTFGHGRDQSIYDLVAREMLAGGMPYRDAFDFKPPGVFVVYALARALFGGSMLSIRLVEAAALLTSAWALVWLAKRHFDSARAGWIAAALSTLLQAQLDFWHTAQPESFGGTLTLLALVVVARARDAQSTRTAALRWIGAGALFGAAGLMKPPLAGGGAMVALVALVAAWTSPARGDDAASEPVRARLVRSLTPAGFIAIGGALPIALTAAWFAAKGALGDLHEVLFVFTPHYTKLSWQHTSVAPMAYHGVVEWLTGYSSALFFGIVVLAVARPAKGGGRYVAELGAVIAIHVAGIVMQGKFFPYHWGATFPLSAALAGAGLDRALALATRAHPGLGAAFAGLFALVAQVRCPVPSFGDAFAARSERRLDLLRGKEPRTPAAWDALATVADVDAAQNRAVADYVAAHTAPTDPLFVWGFECAIYALAERPLASRYIYDVPQRATWSAAPMQAAIMRELAARPPAMIVVEHGDVFPDVTGNRLDSAQSLDDFEALSELLTNEYAFATRIGDFDLYRRNPSN
jgi:hypothetical protein